MIPFPDKKYKIIYADPPWQYRDSTVPPDRKIENHYPTMKTDDICSLIPPSDNNCILFLWVSYPLLEDGLKVLNSWGFKYKSCLVWDKEIMGCGYWFRGQHELLLVGLKGEMRSPPNSDRISSIFREKRKEHSKKPKKIRTLINLWYPTEPKIELFSRDKIEGWDCWGNEVPTDEQRLIKRWCFDDGRGFI